MRTNHDKYLFPGYHKFCHILNNNYRENIKTHLGFANINFTTVNAGLKF
jgi:hypothetical protein